MNEFRFTYEFLGQSQQLSVLVAWLRPQYLDLLWQDLKCNHDEGGNVMKDTKIEFSAFRIRGLEFKHVGRNGIQVTHGL